MASEGPLQDLVEEATCSICLEYFQDPVFIPECGHNFCRGCLTRSWETSESEASCPQCRQTFAPRSVLTNRQLARMVEVAKRCGGPWGEDGGSFCPKHREPLKLFCKDHETLICVVCIVSEEHKGHSVIPPEEAFPKYKIKAVDCLKVQKAQKEKISTYKRDTEKTVQEILDKMKEMKKDLMAEFRELQLLLEAQEQHLLTRMEEMEKDLMAREEKGLAKHMEELCSLDHLIQQIEEKLQEPASKLLQDIGSILKKYQAKETYENPVDLLLEPKWAIWDYSDDLALLKRTKKKLRDTLESGLQLQEEAAAMAGVASLQGFLEEATCSICLEYFQDPVLIPECGHNFCRSCLTRSWGTSESEASCPQCRQTFAPRSVLPNRPLARVAEEAKRCEGSWVEEGESFCPKHREPLKLFCKDDETLICVDCMFSKEHKGHSVIPPEEAFPEYQIEVGHCLKAQKEQREKIATYEEDTEQTVPKVLDIGSILRKYQAKETYENPVDLFIEPKWAIWDYSNLPALLKSARKKMRDILESGFQLQEENVTLDPGTADPNNLHMSGDQKSITGVKTLNVMYFVSKGQIFEFNPYVLGCQKFSTGRHFWEVIVGDGAGWGVGIAKKPENATNVDVQTNHWQIGEWKGKYMAISPSKRSYLVLTGRPTRIRVSLNCEEGKLDFFDGRTAALLHTFSDASLVGETLWPCFFLRIGVCMTLL
ncbi:E3 ubiquitin-protein ligase TRIM39-like isoform X2 [Erythrolamprus reginae]|uniref:E3 ubiquitin-protein ligase TRIM39-like isoform X2 n=1 Tax=Erythrolamprus reginae TaxID=121349 RepID=UPI00396CEB9B